MPEVYRFTCSKLFKAGNLKCKRPECCFLWRFSINIREVKRQKAEWNLGSSVVPVCAQQSKWRKNVMCVGKRLFPYLKTPLERRAWEWNPITHIDSLSRTAELPIFLDRLFYMPALWFNTSDWFFFSWNVKYKTVKVFQVCSTSSRVCKSLFYILTYSGASSYGNKSIDPCVTLFP